MLTDVKNSALYIEWLNYIEDSKVRAAFRYIVGLAACSNRFQCHIQWKGEVRDFRFHDDSGDQPHSFITNLRWLLFYFRPPAIRASRHARDSLQKAFDSFEETPAGEWTVKLRCISDVDKLTKCVQF